MKIVAREKKKTSAVEFCENHGIQKEAKQCLKKGSSILST